ncbi:hypothetical protein A9Q83_14085 [Alphaproteobacteria bacterium 46_93_T64]|nr:hypothetical protein A9Q83_14085 [Alphaproteobacteria bacterium 46_93_T64]
MEIHADTAGTIVSLPNILNLSVAEELKEKFLQQIPVKGDLELDADHVETITTPCIQVIISAGLSVEDSGNKLAIHNPSQAFSDAFRDLGLIDLLEKWKV